VKFLEQNKIVVNLDNVSSIMFEKQKIIFNFNYGVTLSTKGMDKIIPDYVYFNRDEEIFTEIIDYLNANGWITFKNSDNPNRWVNPKCISFIKYEKRHNKYRIIANLNTSVTLGTNKTDFLTSDAVYWDFIDEQDFEDAKTSLLFILGI
jgi:hypothetical protein